MIQVRVLREGREVAELPVTGLSEVAAEPGSLFYGAQAADDRPTRLWELDLIVGRNYLLSFHKGGPIDPEAVTRRVIGPMRDAMVVLLRRDLGLFSHETQVYLQDVYDHLVRLWESVEDYQDLVGGAMDANATMASNRVNTVARNLAAYAAIFAVVTMISGVYGMNFANMPELSWRFGYGWALGLMVVCAGGLWVYFRRKGWL